VIHHSASVPSTSVEDIHRWHLARGWSGIGYHYYIDEVGGVWQGRPEWTQGAHAYLDALHEANSDGIGICLAGNFENGPGPTEAQMRSLVELITNIRTRYVDIPAIGHKEVQSTACPGQFFPWADLYRQLGEIVATGGDETVQKFEDQARVKVEMFGVPRTDCILVEVEGRPTTYIPAIALRESGHEVVWDEDNRLVIIKEAK